MTLRELAEALPEEYARHPRTIRRDLEALELNGGAVPSLFPSLP